jgi:hypothetical protein
MRIRDMIADVIKVVLLFGGTYGMLLIGYGMGWQ